MLYVCLSAVSAEEAILASVFSCPIDKRMDELENDRDTETWKRANLVCARAALPLMLIRPVFSLCFLTPPTCCFSPSRGRVKGRVLSNTGLRTTGIMYPYFFRLLLWGGGLVIAFFPTTALGSRE